MTNIAMEKNCPFIDDLPSELNLHLWLGFSMAMLVITRWYTNRGWSNQRVAAYPP